MASEDLVNLELVRKAIRSKPKFEQAIKILSARARGRGELTCPALNKKIKATPDAEPWSNKDFEEFFKLLQSAGVGRILYSGDVPRFNFAFHLQSFACAVLEIPDPGVKKKKFGDFGQPTGQIRKATPPRKKYGRVASDGAVPSSTKSFVSVEPQLDISQSAKKALIKHLREFAREFDTSKMTPKAARLFTEILITLSELS